MSDLTERAHEVLATLLFQREPGFTVGEIHIGEALAFDLLEYHGDHWRRTALGHEVERLDAARCSAEVARG